jgi:very-short-patch-repair endonuclease
MKEDYSNVLPTIRFGHMKKDTLKQEGSHKSTRSKICPTCKREFVSSQRGKAGQKQVHCSRKCQKNGVHKTVTKNCEQCGQEFTFRSTGKRNNDKRKFCSNPCAATWRMAQPERKELAKEYLPRAWAASQAATRGKPNPVASARMKANNPNTNPMWKQKMSKLMSGRTFLARGGNGTVTRQQRAVASALELPMEYPIPTGPVKARFQSLPNCYKVDVADPSRMLAIEIDGSTHNTKKWKFLDRRKMAVLKALGWSVLRFSNQRVDSDLEGVLKEIKEFTALK